MSTYDDEDDDRKATPGKQLFFEFECTECNANNPWPDGFKAKEEIMCHYCGTTFEPRVTDEGKLKLKAI
jgi:DNA-directed RNA polymerase subunit RPC12/RpoP